MPRIVKHIPDRNKRLSYHWDDWLDGKLRKFTRGKEFVSVNSVRGSAFRAAESRGLDVTIVMRGDAVYIQSHKRKRKKSRKAK